MNIFYITKYFTSERKKSEKEYLRNVYNFLSFTMKYYPIKSSFREIRAEENSFDATRMMPSAIFDFLARFARSFTRDV